MLPQRKIFWGIVAGLGFFLVFGNQGFRRLVVILRENHRLGKVLTSLRADHDRLERELTWIQKDPAYSEYLIRKNLGYVKKGEVEYRFMKKGKEGATPP